MSNQSMSAEHSIEKKLGTLATNHAQRGAVAESDATDESRIATAAQAAEQYAMKGFQKTAEPAKGVAIVAVDNPTLLAVSISAVVDSILHDGTIADMPVCPIEAVTFLYPAGSREAEPVKAYAAKHIKTKKLLMAQTDDCSRLNPTSPEGGHIVVNHLKPGECVIAYVDYKDVMRDDVLVTLAHLKAAAAKIGALIVIVILYAKKQDVTWLGQHCDVFVAVGKCEPGPGAQAAVVLINETLAGWHLQGIGRVMVEAKLVSGGDWTYRREPFIAERAIIRLAWYLYAEGVTIEKIAQVIGIHKSNVSRGFDALLIPPKNTVGLAPPKDFRKRWARQYKLDDVSLSKMSGAAIDDSGASESATTPVTHKSDGADHASDGASTPNRAHTASPNGKQ